MKASEIDKLVVSLSKNAMFGQSVNIEYSQGEYGEKKCEGNDKGVLREAVKLSFTNGLLQNGDMWHKVIEQCSARMGSWILAMMPYVTIIWLAYIAKWIVEIMKRG